ncbi:hypothetical protein AB3R30_18910 [Leptolyngbyaceae cyanobacterium UHCC 1019]
MAARKPLIYNAGLEILQPSDDLWDTIQLSYTLASGAGSGTSTQGWNTFPLNTENLDTGGHCSLSSNRFTLAAGTYEFFDARFRRFCVNGTAFGHLIRVRNITDSADVSGLICQGCYGSLEMILGISGKFTLAASKALEIQIYANAQTSFAWGVTGSVAGYSEIYGSFGLYKSP